MKGNKRTKKNYHQENMDYLTQIVRNKNKEVKRGGSKEKIFKLLLDNAEIEKLLSKEVKPKKNRHQEITNMIDTKTVVEEVDVKEPKKMKIKNFFKKNNEFREQNSNNNNQPNKMVENKNNKMKPKNNRPTKQVNNSNPIKPNAKSNNLNKKRTKKANVKPVTKSSKHFPSKYYIYLTI